MSVPPSGPLRHVRFAGTAPDSRTPTVGSTPAFTPSFQATDAIDGILPPSPEGFAAWLLTQAGLEPADYRAAPLERRVPACLRALKVDSESAARQRIEEQPGLLQAALDVLLIGVTEFFRDAAVFDVLKREVLPTLAEGERPVRVWSVGCSSGAELYSIAILLAEAGLLGRGSLVGTDCRASAIETARMARYPEGALACVPAELRDRYFTREGDDRRLVRSIRDRAEWRVRDVLFHAEPGPWDLVLCRNVTIYLSPDASRRVTSAAAGGLGRGGFIVVGRAERLPAGAGLAPMTHCVYRRDV